MLKNPVVIVLLSFVFSAAAVLLLVLTGEKFDPAAFSSLVQFNATGALLLVPTLLTWWGLMGLRVQILASQLPGGKNITLWRGTQASLLSLFSAAVTPAASGSSVGLGWFLSRFIDPKQATAIAVYGLVLDLVFYAWSLPLSYFILQWRKLDLGIPLLGTLVLFGTVVAMVLAWGLANGGKSLSRVVWQIFSLGVLKRFRRGAFGFVQRTAKEISSLRQMPWWVQLQLHLINGASWIFHFAAFNVVAHALSIPNFDHIGILAAQSLVVSSSFVVPTPGGSGYFEFALGKVFSVIGVSKDAITPLVLVWRLLSYYLYILIGPMIGGLALLRATSKQ
jgi:glycosyltransferase 2 family protein